MGGNFFSGMVRDGQVQQWQETLISLPLEGKSDL
jgi:hypothetical protein